MFEKWITNGTASPFYARKVFEVRDHIVKAEAKVCGLGQFHFFINGKKVSDHELDPGWTDYRKLVQYVTFDVTEYLQPGKNVMGAEVGNGWYIKQDEHYTFQFPAFMPPNPNPYRPFGKVLVLALELCITYQDGSSERIRTDDSFKVKRHPVIMSNVYGSETMDGRLKVKNWCSLSLDDSGWEKAQYASEKDIPGGILQNQFQPPVKVIHTYEGRELPKVGERRIFDFQQNMSGILEVELKGHKGDKICFYPAEKCKENGDVDQFAKGWVDVDSCITFILGEDDTWEKFRLHFTYFAGRYMAVEGLEGADHEIGIRNLKAHAITGAWQEAGHFSCDDKRYNQIYDLVEKAVEANMVSVHTDCPTIERFAWQEPNHLMAPSIMYMKDGRKLWEKFLLDMRMSQHTAEDYFLDYEGNKIYPGEGLMPSQCPCYIPNVIPVPGMGSFYDIIAWGSTCILGTWWHYMFYGDPKILEENYEAGRRYLAHLKTKLTQEGFISHGLGDWGNPENHLLRENVETVFLYADAVTLEKMAGILGKEEDRAELHIFGEQVKENYNRKLLACDPNSGHWCYRDWESIKQGSEEWLLTQTSQALPLYWGMVPEEKLEDVVWIFRKTLKDKQAFSAGEIGLPYIIQTAHRHGMDDLIGKFILKETHPSYYAFVLDGETTLGEYWEENPRSHCHDMMGHIVEWYYSGIAGINPEEPGFKKVRIAPYLPESMKEFTCTFHSASGPIKVQVKDEDERILLRVQVPEGIPYKVENCGLEKRNKPVVTENICVEEV